MNDMRQFDLHKIFFGDVSLGEPVGMATEAKSRRQTGVSDDELIYYAFIALGFPIKEAREMVANRKERVEQELALYFALREANRESDTDSD